jgi:hypothetical protein
LTAIHRVEVGLLRVLDRRVPLDAGVVMREVEPAVGLDGRGDKCLAVGRAGDVRRDEPCLPAGLLDQP